MPGWEWVFSRRIFPSAFLWLFWLFSLLCRHWHSHLALSLNLLWVWCIGFILKTPQQQKLVSCLKGVVIYPPVWKLLCYESICTSSTYLHSTLLLQKRSCSLYVLYKAWFDWPDTAIWSVLNLNSVWLPVNIHAFKHLTIWVYTTCLTVSRRNYFQPRASQNSFGIMLSGMESTTARAWMIST